MATFINQCFRPQATMILGESQAISQPPQAAPRTSLPATQQVFVTTERGIPTDRRHSTVLVPAGPNFPLGAGFTPRAPAPLRSTESTGLVTPKGPAGQPLQGQPIPGQPLFFPPGQGPFFTGHPSVQMRGIPGPVGQPLPGQPLQYPFTPVMRPSGTQTTVGPSPAGSSAAQKTVSHPPSVFGPPSAYPGATPLIGPQHYFLAPDGRLVPATPQGAPLHHGVPQTQELKAAPMSPISPQTRALTHIPTANGQLTARDGTLAPPQPAFFQTLHSPNATAQFLPGQLVGGGVVGLGAPHVTYISASQRSVGGALVRPMLVEGGSPQDFMDVLLSDYVQVHANEEVHISKVEQHVYCVNGQNVHIVYEAGQPQVVLGTEHGKAPLSAFLDAQRTLRLEEAQKAQAAAQPAAPPAAEAPKSPAAQAAAPAAKASPKAKAKAAAKTAAAPKAKTGVTSPAGKASPKAKAAAPGSPSSPKAKAKAATGGVTSPKSGAATASASPKAKAKAKSAVGTATASAKATPKAKAKAKAKAKVAA